MAILTGMKIIYNDIIPFKGYKAINLFGIVFARKSARPLSDKNKNHEAIHTAQMRELLYVPFYIVYLFGLGISRLQVPKDNFRTGSICP